MIAQRRAAKRKLQSGYLLLKEPSAEGDVFFSGFGCKREPIWFADKNLARSFPDPVTAEEFAQDNKLTATASHEFWGG